MKPSSPAECRMHILSMFSASCWGTKRWIQIRLIHNSWEPEIRRSADCILFQVVVNEVYFNRIGDGIVWTVSLFKKLRFILYDVMLKFVYSTEAQLLAYATWSSQRYVNAKVVSDLEIGRDRTLVGAISWGDSVDIDFRLDDYVTRAEVLNALDYIRYTGGLTNTAAALSVLRTQMFWTSSRPSAILPGFTITTSKRYVPTKIESKFQTF